MVQYICKSIPFNRMHQKEKDRSKNRLCKRDFRKQHSSKIKFSLLEIRDKMAVTYANFVINGVQIFYGIV